MSASRIEQLESALRGTLQAMTALELSDSSRDEWAAAKKMAREVLASRQEQPASPAAVEHEMIAKALTLSLAFVLNHADKDEEPEDWDVTRAVRNGIAALLRIEANEVSIVPASPAATDEREAFEAWVKQVPDTLEPSRDFTRKEQDGSYFYSWVESNWQAFKAGVALAAAPSPEGEGK